LPFSSQRLEQILVKSLKKYVQVKKVHQVKNAFHPQKNTLKKEYRYFINTGNYNHFTQKYR
jgi:tRNA U38,U39,U40 pseudouridine synthase TruA